MICYRCNEEYPSNKFCPVCYSEGYDNMRSKEEAEIVEIDLLQRANLQPRFKGTKNHKAIWD